MEKYLKKLLGDKVDTLIGKALLKQVFTACSIGVFYRRAEGTESIIFNYGHSGLNEETKRTGLPVDDCTIFDLASLTKPLVTSLSVLALLEEGGLRLEETLDSFFDLSVYEHGKITINHLLNHCSGLPAHRPFYEELTKFPERERKKRLVELILKEKLEAKPGSRHVYSDLGFILLGEIIEQVSGERLDIFWQEKIAQALVLDKELFFPGKGGVHGGKKQSKEKQPEDKNREKEYVPTGFCPWSGKVLRGEVHDDNCRSLGGVAGHAGLFGTCRGVLGLLERLSAQFNEKETHPSYSSDILRKVLSNKQGNWRFGFDTPSGEFSSSGRYFREMTIGHLGFTGTSFWLDLERQIGIVLLTNRVISGEKTIEIKRLRPRLHDLIMECL